MNKHIVITQEQKSLANYVISFSLLFSFICMLVIAYLVLNPITRTTQLPPLPPKTKYVNSYVPAYKVLTRDDFKQMNCMAKNIYHEARGELLAGKYSSGHSVINRVNDKKFPNTICEVVYHKVKGVAQYSWINDGKSDATNDQEAWNLALEISYKIMFVGVDDITDGALFYHKNDGKTKFAEAHYANIEEVGMVGRHIFFKRKDS